MSEPMRAVVFDLDGTLLDSMPLVLRGYAHALAPHCGPLSGGEILARLGGPPDRVFAEMLGEPGRVADALRRWREFNVANGAAIRPFAGAKELLAELRAAGCGVAVWTGRERESTEWMLREHGFDPHVAAVVCGDDLASHKPDPAGLAEALRRLGAPVAAARFVGDADVDVLAGAALGVRTLLISGGRAVDAAVRAKAWRVAATPGEAYARVRAELASPDGAQAADGG